MERFEITTDYDSAYIIICFAIAGLYAWILYRKKSNLWNKATNIGLTSLRFFLVFILSFLLLNPLLKYLRNNLEIPVWVFALDNSESMSSTSANELLAPFQQLDQSIISRGTETAWRSFTEDYDAIPDSVDFSGKETQINTLLSTIKNDYEGRNLAGVTLISDGIVNSGMNPEYANYGFPLYTVGVGDTVQKPDAIVTNILYNKIAYQGNRFPVVAEVLFKNLEGNSARVELMSEGKLIESRELAIESNSQFEEVRFEVKAEKAGFNQLVARVVALQNEFTTQNNSKSAYIEVVEGRDKVLLLAPAPHPDIKAIRSAVNSSENYELTTYIHGLDTWKEDKFDVVIYYQVPDAFNRLNKIFIDLQQKNIPALYVFGSQSNRRLFNENGTVSVKVLSNQADYVFPKVADNFTLFNFKDKERIYSSFSPVSVPFADYRIKADASVLLYQKVGNINTDKPLWVLHQQEGKKQAVMLGEGFWQWRLQNYKKSNSFADFDEMVLKTIQFLSARDDKRKFRVYPINKEIEVGETLIFETEYYNDLYERIYEGEVQLTITKQGSDETRDFQYLISEGNTRYRISGLDEGIYSYSARLVGAATSEASSGRFLVKELKLEMNNLVANHNLLRNISSKSGGNFYKESEVEQLAQSMLAREFPKRIHVQEQFTSLIEFRWLFFVLLLLISLEWFVRKYMGGY